MPNNQVLRILESPGNDAEANILDFLMELIAGITYLA